MGDLPEPIDIPAFLKRDGNNKAEFMMAELVSEVVPESRPAKSKAKAPDKATQAPKAKAAGKAPVKAKPAPKATAKAAKAPDKAKAAKPKADAAPKDQYGFRKGSSKSEAVALYARKSGATLAEVKERIGSVQLNVLMAMEVDGYKVEKKKEERDGQRPVTRYFLKGKS